MKGAFFVGLVLLIAGATWVQSVTVPVPGSVSMTFTASGGCVSGAPPVDATALIQGCIDSAAGAAEAVIPCGVWNVSGLTAPAGGLSLRGARGCTTLHVTANAAAISCSGVSAPIVVQDITITGTAPNYSGTINISDADQEGVHVVNCPNVTVTNVSAANLSGSAFDCENPAGAFNSPASITFSNVAAFNSYRAIYPRNSCEYSIFSGVTARNNIFGAVIAAGNVKVDTFQFAYNYTNIQIIGQSNANPCHGSFSNGMANHGVYNLDVLSCSVGHDFINVRFIADQDGSLTSGGGLMRIANSRGVNIMGGSMGSNISVLQADPVTESSASAGANKLEGAFIRDDIAGFTNPAIGYAGGLQMKLNFDAEGQWAENN